MKILFLISEIIPDLPLQILGLCLGGEALDDLTLSVNEKLGEVPFDGLA